MCQGQGHGQISRRREKQGERRNALISVRVSDPDSLIEQGKENKPSYGDEWCARLGPVGQVTELTVTPWSTLAFPPKLVLTVIKFSRPSPRDKGGEVTMSSCGGRP